MLIFGTNTLIMRMVKGYVKNPLLIGLLLAW